MKLNLGCGRRTVDGYVNIDRVKFPGVDIVTDLDVSPWPVDDSACDEVQAWHVFEHVADPCLFMGECWRVLEPGGLLVIVSPLWTHTSAFTDPTHRRFCTPETWDYWVPGTMYHEPEVYGPATFAHESGGVDKARSSLRVVLRKIMGGAGPGASLA
jgi:SAM-dependent methyltransferase